MTFSAAWSAPITTTEGVGSVTELSGLEVEVAAEVERAARVGGQHHAPAPIETFGHDADGQRDHGRGAGRLGGERLGLDHELLALGGGFLRRFRRELLPAGQFRFCQVDLL